MSPTPRVAVWRSLDDVPLNTRRCFRLPISSMPDGSSLSIPVNAVVGSKNRPALLAVAGHHGDEQEGPAALISLWQQLRPAAMRGCLLIVPVLNPPSFQAVRRTSYEDQLDINRIFPGRPDGTVTERLAYALCDRLLPAADLVLSMHGWSAGYLVEPYVEYPKSGAVRTASRRAAAAFGLRLLNPLDAGPGRLLTEASARGVPVIEVEIGGQASSVPDRRLLYEAGTMNLLRHLGVLPQARSPNHLRIEDVDRIEVVAPVGGMMRAEAAVGAQVEKGQPLATIYDLNLNPLAELVSPTDGLVGVGRLAASVLPGQLVATIFVVRARAHAR